MKHLLLFIINFMTICVLGQNISSVNSGAFNTNNLIFTVGEVYVNPVNMDKANSGIIAVVSRIEFFTLGEDEQIFSNDFNIFPNPTQKTLHFSTNIPFHKIYIYDATGKLVAFQKIKNSKIDVTNLAIGIYYIKTENPKIKTIKIIKK